MRVPSQQEFLRTPAGVHAQRELKHMVSSRSYDTDGSLDPQIGKGQTFVERHLNYLIKHPYVAPAAYLSNLRIMTRSRR
ncbi:MAG TPA: hypothetical protein VFX84_02945 [Candidatus Saccharimonadales bacterium]|nr:hypothetical protein [Candidatus Saccharimonadales bacterium]